MADWCGVTQGFMGCLGYVNYSLLYEATVLKYNLTYSIHSLYAGALLFIQEHLCKSAHLDAVVMHV